MPIVWREIIEDGSGYLLLLALSVAVFSLREGIIRLLPQYPEKVIAAFPQILRQQRTGTVEIILIIVVLIGLVIIFKKQLRALVEKIFPNIAPIG